MKRGNNPLVLCLFGILPVVWLGLLIAPAAGGGLPEILARFPAAMNDLFHIELCVDSVKTVLVLLCVYGLSIGVFLSSRRNYRRGEEHGSAKWGNARAVNKKYRAAKPEENKIFTQNVRMGLDDRKHRRNLNTIVVGGSGAGKTRFYGRQLRRVPLPRRQRNLDPQADFRILSRQGDNRHQHLRQIIGA